MTEEDNDIIEINLGHEMVAQLDGMFGIETFPSGALKTMRTNVFMPKSLAKQLYALWMESAYNQMEEQKQLSIKEDEEFARSLHTQEKYPELTKNPTNFKEIMEMEEAWSKYKAEIDKWKNNAPETMASQLTKDKLYETFPHIDRELLVEVLSAHNNKYDETVATLQDSLKDHEYSEEYRLKLLLERAHNEANNKNESTFKLALVNSDSSDSLNPQTKINPEQAKNAALKQFEDCRNNAMHHQQLKAECYAKAREAIQQGKTSVALYFSQVASLHKTKIDMYNNIAANCIMDVHNFTQNNPDIVDLHYLRVNEAVEWLDIFLDKHITKLKANGVPYKNVHVITGRGAHSAGGVALIKQKVKHRLKERKLR